MGYGKWKSDEYSSYARGVATKPTSELFHRTSEKDVFRGNQNLNPETIQFRESRDSEAHPHACPIIVGLDVSGSMDFISVHMVKEALGEFVNEVIQRKPVGDPHLLFMGYGDAVNGDSAPLQVTQFETDTTICEQLTDVWLEGGGGGNHFESDDLVWAFAAFKTQTDQWDKRKEKGYLFTVGDEDFPMSSDRAYLKKFLGKDCPQSTTPASLLEAAQERFHVFHVIVAEGLYAQRRLKQVENNWGQHLQKRCLTLDHHTHIAEVIVSAIAVNEGADVNEVIDSWSDAEAKSTVKLALLGNHGQ